ncbi:MAG: hypothetical protein WAL75_05770 [Terracidiphilus sp.]
MIRTNMVVLTLAGIWLASPVSEAALHSKEPVDYVAPNIGGIGQLLTATLPAVQFPYGMAQLFPITTPGITDRYLADKIFGFPAGPAELMASVGPIGASPDEYASDFDHDFEVSTPYYYEADLLTWGVKAECTATPEAAYYRFTFPASKHSHLKSSGEAPRRMHRRRYPEMSHSETFLSQTARNGLILPSSEVKGDC